MQVSLYRYSPETDEAPKMQAFRVDTGGKDLMVLDVLELVKSQLDSSVAYRRSCREGVCGSDGLNMNGKNGLACITPLSEVVKKGNLSSLNAPEEISLAEKLIEIHPWAQMVRFTRTGGEANSVAIRIARASSGKRGVRFSKRILFLLSDGSLKLILSTFNKAKYLSLSFGGLIFPDTESPVLKLNLLI